MRQQRLLSPYVAENAAAARGLAEAAFPHASPQVRAYAAQQYATVLDDRSLCTGCYRVLGTVLEVESNRWFCLECAALRRRP